MVVTNFNFVEKTLQPITINNNELKNLNFLIIPTENIDFNLNIILNGEQSQKIVIGIYNHHNYQVKCRVDIQYQNEHNACEIEAIVLGEHTSNTEVTIATTIIHDNNQISQNIKGYLLSPHAKIAGLPILDITTNNVIAAHGLAIGSLNKEQIFYLMTKGLNKQEVKKILLLSQFENLLSSCDEIEKQNYLTKINNLWSLNND